MLAPLSNYGAFDSAISYGDPKLLAWTFAWVDHAILNGLPLFDANSFYPARPALAFAEHHVGVAIWGLPLYLLTGNAVLVYSCLRILALALNGVAMHLFVWRITQDRRAALLAGVLFSVSAPRLLYSGYVPLLWNCWLPLLLLAVDKWLSVRRWKWIFLSTALFCLHALTTWYQAVMAGVAVGLLAVWRCAWAGLSRGREPAPSADGRAATRPSVHLVPQCLVASLLVAAVIWPFARPYLALRDLAVPVGREYSTGVADYLLPTRNSVITPLMARVIPFSPGTTAGERTQFLGWLAVLLAAVGAAHVLAAVFRARREVAVDECVKWGGYLLALAVLAAGLAAGPSSRDALVPAPFTILSHVPVLNLFRVPPRFAVLVVFAVAGLAGLGFWRIANRKPSVAAVAFWPLIAGVLFESAIVPPKSERPRAERVPGVYELVAQLPVNALVSLPCYRRTGPASPGDADYLLYSTVHWKRIVNGYGRHDPPGFHWVLGTVNAFPGHNSAVRMQALGIDYVVLHPSRYPDGARGILDEALSGRDFRLVAAVDGDYLFHVQPSK